MGLDAAKRGQGPRRQVPALVEADGAAVDDAGDHLDVVGVGPFQRRLAGAPAAGEVGGGDPPSGGRLSGALGVGLEVDADATAEDSVVVAPGELEPAAAAVAEAVARGLAAIAHAVRVDPVGELLLVSGELLGMGNAVEVAAAEDGKNEVSGAVEQRLDPAGEAGRFMGALALSLIHI